ncbi:LysR family transcriptional regulator, partial [Serratia nevei]|uniref:LysR family transcriptional regulator n=2 Tax=Serratia TaxID=613 RepID=UPI003F7F5229
MDVLLTMRAFRRVVERNSFYKAAEDLAITPAALSKQIKQLENRLGTLLLVRTTRSMSLTEAGLLYYQEACRLLGEFDALEQTVAASAQQVSGMLRVNAPLSFGLTVLSPLLPPFMQRYPQLQVELTLDDRVLDVVAAGFDISLRIRRRLPDSSLSARALGEVHQRICAAPG